MPLNLTSERWDQLRSINWRVNQSIAYTTPSPWERVNLGEDARGDCKAYATTKFDALVAAGWPSDDLYVAECAVPPAPLPNHAVLLIDAEQGCFVCSNGIDEPTPIRELGWTHWLRFKHGTRDTEIEYFTFDGDTTPPAASARPLLDPAAGN